MKQKIEWYREVLELEPGSRVFFPLAKLLAQDGRPGEAADVLRLGLSRRPDHVEARLLLVELLSRLGDEAGLDAEMSRLETLFSAYPAFWRTWNGRLSREPEMRDAALAGRFLSLSLQGRPLGWAEVIEEGLRALGGTGAESAPAFAPPRAAPEPAEMPEEIVAVPAVEAPVLADFEEDEAEEPFSLRTRSMADVLAEQGDVKGALEIYRELEPGAAPDEKAEMAARILELEKRLQASPAEAQSTQEKQAAPAADGARLVDLLESLAKRLEARAR